MRYDYDWMSEGKCTTEQAGQFFPEVEKVTRSDTAAARSICSGCPVQTPCAAFRARTGTRQGVWGGRNGAPRRRASA